MTQNEQNEVAGKTSSEPVRIVKELNYEIAQSKLQAIGAYLEQKPFREVVGLLNMLQGLLPIIPKE